MRPPSRRDRISAAALRITRAAARRVGLVVLRSNYSSPVPELRSLDPARWSAPLPIQGIDLRLDRQRDLLARLRPFFAEFYALLDDADVNGFDPANRMFGSFDAEALYAIVRDARPALVVEVGSGNSTLITARALEVNRDDGFPGEVVSIDPRPRLEMPPLSGHRHISGRAEDAAESLLRDLREDDVLFIDSSHVVRTGGDVNYLILELLPQLPPGVLVHFHDVFLPWDYPREDIIEGKYWTEQYLLQAFLIENPRFEVVLAAHALVRSGADGLQFVRGIDSSSPGSFWIRSMPREHS